MTNLTAEEVRVRGKAYPDTLLSILPSYVPPWQTPLAILDQWRIVDLRNAEVVETDLIISGFKTVELYAIDNNFN